MEKPESPIRQVKLGDLTFDNPFTDELRGDEEIINNRRQVHNAYYSRVLPTPTAAPETLVVSEEVSLLLGITSDIADSAEPTEIFFWKCGCSGYGSTCKVTGGINLGIGLDN